MATERDAKLDTPSARVSDQMRAQAVRDTKPEMRLRRELFARARRFRVHYVISGLPRRVVDIAFPGSRVAVFVDGCFWHGCADHKTIPRANRAWWKAKIDANRRRDEETSARLSELGWTPVRVWEHEDPKDAADRICRLLDDRGRAGKGHVGGAI